MIERKKEHPCWFWRSNKIFALFVLLFFVFSMGLFRLCLLFLISVCDAKTAKKCSGKFFSSCLDFLCKFVRIFSTRITKNWTIFSKISINVNVFSILLCTKLVTWTTTTNATWQKLCCVASCNATHNTKLINVDFCQH